MKVAVPGGISSSFLFLMSGLSPRADFSGILSVCPDTSHTVTQGGIAGKAEGLWTVLLTIGITESIEELCTTWLTLVSCYSCFKALNIVFTVRPPSKLAITVSNSVTNLSVSVSPRQLQVSSIVWL